MKQLLLFAVTLGFLSSCSKETVCIGSDCTWPEAVVTIDSISNKVIYATLQNSTGESFVCPLAVSPSVDFNEFMRFTGFDNANYADNQSESANGRVIKVYYIAVDQSYVHNDAEYINAHETSLEIEAFGDSLRLTY